MWHALAEEENRPVANANEIFLNENKQNTVMIQEQLTKVFEFEHVILAHVLDLDDVTFELKDQVRLANEDRRYNMIVKKKSDEISTEWSNEAFEKQGIANALNDQVVEFMPVNKQHKLIIAHYRSIQSCINNRNKEMQKVCVKGKRGGGARW